MQKCIFFLLFITSIQAYSADYYWVGGTGKWSELFHWATTSGGNAFHSAVPDAEDNVIFDANSFSTAGQIVTLDVGSAYCKDFIFNAVNNPIIRGSQRLLIFGSMQLVDNMQFEYSGQINFESSAATFQLTTAGHTLINSLYFNGNGANWTFDKLTLKGKMFVNGSNCTFTFANDLSLTDNESVDAERASLFIKGNANTLTFNGNAHFDRTLNITATSSQISFANSMDVGVNFFVDALQSTISISKPLKVGDKLTINAGTFTTNNQNISTAYFLSNSSSVRTLNLGSSNFEVGEWVLSSINLTFNMLPNTILFTGGGNFASDNLKYYNLIFKAFASISGNNCKIDTIKIAEDCMINAQDFDIHYFELKGNGDYRGSNTFDFFILNAQTEHIFLKGTTQTIKNQLKAIGNCTGYLFFHSDEKLKTAAIQLSGATANIEYAIIRDMEGIGGLLALNSVDLGNNNGWTITSPTPQNLYWVGNAGNWSDSQHWSFASGGVGGACIPSPNDNVIFDSKSFSIPSQAVTVDVQDAFCSSMTWANDVLTPVFKNSDADCNLYLFGSLSLSSSMIYNLNAVLNFEARTKGHTVNTAGQMIKNDVLFAGMGGGWTLISDLDVSLNNIELKNGALNTHGMAVVCMDFKSKKNQTTRELRLESSVITLHNDWDLANEELTFDAGTSKLVFTKISPKMYSGNNLRYHDVLFENEDGMAQLYGENSVYNFVEFMGEGEIRDDAKTFAHLVFRKNGTINKNQTFGILEFTPPFTYTLVYGQVQTITNQLIASGGCSAYITIKSSSPSDVLTFFQKNGGSLDIGYVILQNVGTKGTADFVVHNLAGGVNYPGWRIESSNLPRTLYWVDKGTTANWSDQGNWSVQSGGNGGECLPTQIDNVIFDDKSFLKPTATVNLDNETVECRNMDWSKAPENAQLAQGASNKKLNIYGSLWLAKAMNISYFNPITFFTNDANAVIHLNDNQLKSNLLFDNESGKWTFLSAFKTSGSIQLDKGTLVSNNFDIEAAKFISQTPTKSILNLGSSTLKLYASGVCFDIAGDFELIQDKSEIFLDKNGAGVVIAPQYPLDFHNITFNQSGSLDVSVPYETVTFNKIIFNNQKANIEDNSTIKATDKYNLNLSNVIVADTILFFSNGIIEADKSLLGRVIFDKEAQIKGTNTMQYVEMLGHGKIYGTNSMDTLILSPPERNYQFESGKIQTINKYFKLAGYACGKINVYSSVQNTKAFINSSNAQTEVFGYYVRLSDIQSSGGATFYAGGDSENNAVRTLGWTFAEPPGYIHGLPSDSILIAGETFVIDTKNFNGDRYTTYEWNTGTIAPELRVTKAGKYTVTAHYPGCNFPDEINVYFAHIQNVDCAGQATASISIEYDKTENYVFDWNGNVHSSQKNSPIVSNLSSGVYTVNITNTQSTSTVNLPTTSRIFTITQPATALTATIPSATAQCFNSTNTALTIFAQGGTLPYSYFILNETVALPSIVTGLSPNRVYTFDIVDAHKCHMVQTASIVSPPAISIDYIQTIVPQCFNDTNAEISITVKGGTPNYSFKWNNAATSQLVFSNLPHNQLYTFTVTDSKLCTTFSDISVTAPTPLVATFNIVESPLCFGNQTGVVNVSASGGVGNYRFFLDENVTPIASIISNLSANIPYKVYVLDQNNCEASNEFSLTSPTQLQLSKIQTIDLLCSNSSNGEIRFTASGGTLPYTYHLQNTENQTGIFGSLQAGISYSAHVEDANSCISTQNVLLTAPAALILTVEIENSCGGAATGKAILEVSGGVSPYQIRWNDANQSQTSEIQNLAAGKYQATVTDKNLCTSVIEAEIRAAETVTIQIVNVEHLQCGGDKNGQIEVSVNGGTTPIEYWLNDENPQLHGLFTALSGGNFLIKVRDANGCTSQIETVLNEPQVLQILVTDLKMSCANCNNGSFAYTVSGGTSPYIESVYNSLGNRISSLDKLKADTYEIAVSDSKGCTAGVDVLINEIALDFSIPNIFTPNDDGVNEIFKIKVSNTETYSFIADFKGFIYNRWGEKVYEWNNAAEGWDGKIHSSNREAVSATYFYYIEIKSVDNQKQTFKGAVELSR